VAATKSHERLFYCRAGFEPELAQELEALSARGEFSAYAKTSRGSALVRLVVDAPIEFAARELVFARQALSTIVELDALDPRDRLAPVLAALPAGGRWCDAWVETPDADGGEALAPLARGLEAAFVGLLRKRGLLDSGSQRRLHVVLLSGTRLVVADADVALASPWPGGVPRLKFPRESPSRSTLKLEEALLTLLSGDERDAWLRPGMTAVDLGASPGGWTYQLVRRSIRVTAVDNGPMDDRLMQSGLVEHRREDGFRYRPPKPVDWLVCDMVEQPIRVAALVRDWLEAGACRRAIFNLKLPMKKRWDEVRRCLGALAEPFDDRLEVRAKQLYHDREEVTVFALLPARRHG
jgi:23S rRNA (cytidine2498-2'-O)-methyltransferase